jgi:hypothetical protein
MNSADLAGIGLEAAYQNGKHREAIYFHLLETVKKKLYSTLDEYFQEIVK